MSEQNPRTSGLSPSPLFLAVLILSATLIAAGLFYFFRIETFFQTLMQSAPVAQVTVTTESLTSTPEPELGSIVFESRGVLYEQPVDRRGNPLSSLVRLGVQKSETEKVKGLDASTDGNFLLLYIGTDSSEKERLAVYSQSDGVTSPILNEEDLGLGSKLFGWHPNNREIIYSDGEDIWLVDTFTDSKKLLARPQEWGGLDYPPIVDGVGFSPDGSRLCISYTLTGQGGSMWIANADGSNRNQVLKDDYRFSNLAWSPDGNWIAFAGRGVEIMHPNGENRQTIGEKFAGGASPQWSPESLEIAYTTESAPGYKVKIYSLSNQNERTLIDDTNTSDVLPSWSPDGSRLTVLSNWSDKSGAEQIVTVRRNGKDKEVINADGHSKRVMPFWFSK